MDALGEFMSWQCTVMLLYCHKQHHTPRHNVLAKPVSTLPLPAAGRATPFCAATRPHQAPTQSPEPTLASRSGSPGCFWRWQLAALQQLPCPSAKISACNLPPTHPLPKLSVHCLEGTLTGAKREFMRWRPLHACAAPAARCCCSLADGGGLWRGAGRNAHVHGRL